MYFRTRNITRYQEGHLVMIKGPIHQENVKILIRMHVDNKTSNYMNLVSQEITSIAAV